jgi:hypothetical protein
MRTHQFGEAPTTHPYDSDLEKEISNFTRWVSAINARVQSKQVGIIIQSPGYAAREFWTVPRVFVSRVIRFVDALITPSASRWADWYAAMGFEQVRRNTADIGQYGNQFLRGFRSEIGMKFRIAAPGKHRWRLLGYRFGGLRIGVRANGISSLQQPRLISERGAGAF